MTSQYHQTSSAKERLAKFHWASCGGEPEEESSDKETAEDGTDGAFPGFIGADAGSEFVPAERAARVERRDIAGPDNAEQKNDERGAVGHFAQGGNGEQRKADVDQGEDGGDGVEQDALDGRTEGALGQQAEA